MRRYAKAEFDSVHGDTVSPCVSTGIVACSPFAGASQEPQKLVGVKGKETATEIFEVQDHHTEESLSRFKDAVPFFKEGIRLYRARDWSRALAQFSAVLKLFPNDSPSWVYTDRCLYYRDHPPGGAWDGVWNMQTK